MKYIQYSLLLSVAFATSAFAECGKQSGQVTEKCPSPEMMTAIMARQAAASSSASRPQGQVVCPTGSFFKGGVCYRGARPPITQTK